MSLSLAVFGCRKPKKCTKSKDKKNQRYPALRSSALSTELILPGSVSLSLGVAHLLYWACTRLSGLSGMEVKQRSKDEKRMIREKKPGYFCQICQIVIFYRRRILSVRIYCKRMALFEHDSQVLTVYILGTWQAAMLVDETIYDFFSRNLNEKEFSSQRWETLFVRVNICGHRDVSLKPAMVMWTHALLKPRANGCNFVGQQHIVGCYILRPLGHPVTCFCMLLNKVWNWSNFRANNSQHFFCSMIAEAWRNNVGSVCTALPTLGSLRNDYDDGNENSKKAIGLDKQNNNFARALRFFVHFSAVVARLQHETA